MARKNGSTPGNTEFSSDGSARTEVDDYSGRVFDDGEAFDAARLMDVEPEEESPFLRGQKRVSVRRSPIPRKTEKWLKRTLVGLATTFVAGGILWSVWQYALKAPRFATAASSDSIQITGNRNATREEILAVFGEDISRNIFRVPLERRKRKLEELPWIESATVMRLLPNRIAVVVKERTPIAFVRTESSYELIDAGGVLMNMPNVSDYSFPVLTGFSDSDPLSTRSARVEIYLALLRQLDANGKGYSQDWDTVNVTDPEDIRIRLEKSDVLVHMEKRKFPQKDNFAQQYSKFLEVLPQCRARFGTAALDVDARFENQTPCRLAGASIGAGPGAPSTAQPQPVQPAARIAETTAPTISRRNTAKKKSKWHRKTH